MNELMEKIRDKLPAICKMRDGTEGIVVRYVRGFELYPFKGYVFLSDTTLSNAQYSWSENGQKSIHCLSPKDIVEFIK